MARPKKNGQPVSLIMDKDLFARLEAYCEASGQTKTVAIERAVSMFIDDYDSKMKILNNQSS